MTLSAALLLKILPLGARNATHGKPIYRGTSARIKSFSMDQGERAGGASVIRRAHRLQI